MSRIPSFRTEFCTNCHTLSCKPPKFQPCIYTELSGGELDTLHRLQKKLITQLLFALPQSQGSYMVDTDACNRQLDAYSSRNSPMDMETPLAIGHDRKQRQSVHTTLFTVNFSPLCGPYFFSAHVLKTPGSLYG